MQAARREYGEGNKVSNGMSSRVFDDVALHHLGNPVVSIERARWGELARGEAIRTTDVGARQQPVGKLSVISKERRHRKLSQKLVQHRAHNRYISGSHDPARQKVD